MAKTKTRTRKPDVATRLMEAQALATRPKKIPALPRGAAQALASRSRFMDNIDGITFHGRRNIYEALGYKRLITPQQYRSRFRRNAVASRIVTAAPKATWRSGAEVVESDDPTQTPFEEAFEALEHRLNLWSVFHRADILAGLGRYAVILLGTPGDLEEPLTTLALKDLVYLTPFSEEDSQIEKFDTDVKSPRFGLPVYYNVRRLAPNAFRQNTPETVGRRVHFTRMIHVADGLLDDHVYGIPRLEKVWNLLDDLEKITGGGAEAFWKRADKGLVFTLDPLLQVHKDPKTGKFIELEQMREQIESYEHALQRVLTLRGIKVTELSSDVADISSPVTALMSQISAGSEIPQRVLMGSEAAKLASQQDADAWDERIADRRSEFAAPQIVKPFCDRLITLGALPAPKGNYEVRWPEIKNLNEAQRMDIATKASQLNKNAGQVVITGNEIRDRYLGLDAMEASRGIDEKLPKRSVNPGELERPTDGFPIMDGVPPTDTSVPPTQPVTPPKTMSRWSKGRERSPWAHVHEAADRFRW